MPLLHVGVPLGVPSASWDSLAPRRSTSARTAPIAAISQRPAPGTGLTLTAAESQQFQNDTIQVPACVKACPADALRYGDREDMLQEAREAHCRESLTSTWITSTGEKEAGGTRDGYLSAVPFDKLGFPDVGEERYPGVLTNGAARGSTRRDGRRRDARWGPTRS